jgi:glyoxylase-like metal-dependent hydrolase (beta-lactamase superfamily II)
MRGRKITLCFLVLATAIGFMSALAVAQPPSAAATTKQAAQAAGFYRVRLGEFVVTVLSDGTLHLPFADLLHGAKASDLDQIYRDAGIDSNRETSINAFLIDTGEKRILIDAGAGALFGDCCGHLPETLLAAGYRVDQIDAVLLTHVHGDHSGGLMRDGKRVFPNADIYLAKQELDYWMSDAEKAKAPASHQSMFIQGRAALAPYIAAGKIKTFDGAVEPFPGIKTIPAPGHTPGHSFYEVESNGRRFRVIGDTIHFAEVQFPHPEATVGFDTNEAAAAKARAQALSTLADSHELVAAEHISFPGLGHVYRMGKGFAWAPIPYSASVAEIGQ